MDKIVIESSSDEDDTYTNSVARLRALKKRRLEDEKFAKLISAAVTNKNNAKEIDDAIIITSEVPNNVTNGSDIETEIRITRSRINKEGRGKIRNRGKARGRGRSNFMAYSVDRSTRRRSLINNIECDVDIIPLEDIPNPVSTYNKDDIIPLSSDDDDACDDNDNYEIGIKVFWRSVRLDRLNMRRHDTFLKIFQHYADLEKVSVDEILIMRNDKIINYIDTPASLNLSVIDILDGGIVSPGMRTLCSKDKENKKDKNDACDIKIQTANKKQSLTFSLKKNQQFRTLFSYCALKLSENENNLKFYFDGEQISSTDTPESLDMEGEACIDLRILSA